MRGAEGMQGPSRQPQKPRSHMQRNPNLAVHVRGAIQLLSLRVQLGKSACKHRQTFKMGSGRILPAQMAEEAKTSSEQLRWQL
eukprot:361885-Chlamydomonas_euryale.AAC.19